MTEPRTYSDSIHIDASPDAVYDLVSDVTRTGEWSPICTGCAWNDGAAGPHVGATFTGRNEVPGRVWETVSTVVAAERGREFGWLVSDGYVHWSYLLEPEDGGTRLTESWEFRASGLEFFHENYGERAAAQIEDRTTAARTGIPATLAALKRIAEAG